MTSPLIAILTDFGTSDPFVGIMKGVIAQIAPGVPTIDLTHEIPPGDIRRAAVELWRSTPYFPNGTVFLCVVDPGVGTARRSVIVTGNLMQDRTEKAYTFVGPDNGTFTFLEHTLPAWELKSPSFALQGASSTFHGRDVYAPAAAYAALGHAGAEFGPPVKELVRLPLPRLKTSANGQLQGEILHADHFGNLLTSLGRFGFEGGQLHFRPWINSPKTTALQPVVFPRSEARLHLPGNIELPLVGTFSEIDEGKTAGLVGSTGLLEIAANGQSAAEILNLSSGDLISLSFHGTD